MKDDKIDKSKGQPVKKTYPNKASKSKRISIISYLELIREKVDHIKMGKTKLESSNVLRSLRNKRCEVNFLKGILKDFSSFELSEQLTGKIIEQYKTLSYLLNETKPLPGK